MGWMQLKKYAIDRRSNNGRLKKKEKYTLVCQFPLWHLSVHRQHHFPCWLRFVKQHKLN